MVSYLPLFINDPEIFAQQQLHCTVTTLLLLSPPPCAEVKYGVNVPYNNTQFSTVQYSERGCQCTSVPPLFYGSPAVPMSPPPSLFPASHSSFPPDRTFCNLIASGNNALALCLSPSALSLLIQKENGRPAGTLLNDRPFVLRYTRGRQGSVMPTLVPRNISDVFNVQSANPKKTADN